MPKGAKRKTANKRVQSIKKELLSRQAKIKGALNSEEPISLVQLNELETLYRKPIELSDHFKISIDSDDLKSNGRYKSAIPKDYKELAGLIEKEKLIAEAVRLWKKAYESLEGMVKHHEDCIANPNVKRNHTSYVVNHFSYNDALHEHMQKHGITPEDIREKLSAVSVSEKVKAVLQTLYEASSMYSRGASTLEDPKNIESAFVSSIAKKSEFFMNCRFKPKERIESADTSILSIDESVCGIMIHIKEIASKNTRIDNILLSRILDEKIAVLKNNKRDINELDAIFAYKGHGFSENKVSLLTILTQMKDYLFSTKQPPNLKKQFTQMKKELYSWKNFENTERSPIKIANISGGKSNPRADLYRTSFSSLDREVIIDGVTLREHALKHNSFKTDDDADAFFSQVLLKEFKGSEQQKAIAVGYLKKYFHQGGLMHPVASALSLGLGEGVTVFSSSLQTHVSIDSTPEGFIITEACRCGIVTPSGDVKVPTALPNSEPIKATATMVVDLSKDNGVHIIVTDNKIQINDPELKEKLAPSSIWQCIKDFLYSLFPFISIKDHTPIKEEHFIPKESIEGMEQTSSDKEVEEPVGGMKL